MRLLHLSGRVPSATWQMAPPSDRGFFLLILLIHFLLSGWMASQQVITSDETGYFGYVIRWAKGNPERVICIDDSKTPVVAPALIPVLFKKWIVPKDDIHGFTLLRAGRWCMYMFTALGAFVMFCWLFRLWGSRRWVLPLLLFLFDPVVFSYAMLVASDLPCAVLLVTAAYMAWRYHQSHRLFYWWGFAMACAMAVVAKPSMIFLVPVMALVLAMAGKTRAAGPEKGYLHHTVFRWAVLLLLVWLVVNMAYYFKDSFFPFHRLPQRSLAFRQLAEQLSWLGSFRIPLPLDFVSGFDYVQRNAELGGGITDEHSFMGVFFMGKYYIRGPVWDYYPVTLLFKLPLLTIGLLALTVWLLFPKGLSLTWWRRHLFIWAPAVAYGCVLCFTNPIQIGVRHALLIYPFLYVGISAGVQYLAGFGKKLLTALLILHACSLGYYGFDMMAYTNELIWSKHKVYKYLYDSSVSYGQGKPRLREFLKAHPDYRLPGDRPAPGKYAIDLETVASPLSDNQAAWLRDHFEPSGHYRFVVLLYDISADAIHQNVRVP